VLYVYALHEVDHRFTVRGQVCGDDGYGIGGSVVSVKDSRADVSGSGKTDSNGFYEIVLHLHNENQGDPLVVRSGGYEEEGRVELDPNDPKTERIVTINLGQPCRALPFWSQAGFLAGFFAIAGIIIFLVIRQVGKKKRKVPDGVRKGKGRKS
jgi:hypothetical protein